MSENSTGIEIRSRRVRTEDTELDITPVIDMTFLLISFFVVVSKMDPQAALDLPRAEYGISIPEKNCVVMVVTPGDTGDVARVYRGRSKAEQALLAAANIDDLEDRVAEYVENELSRRPEVQSIMIKAEGAVRTGSVEVVKRGILGSELARARNIYVGVEDTE
jgi:biopolymer transport protein TolR